MNKIVIDKENIIDIKDNAIELIINVDDLTINVKGKVLINEIQVKTKENLKLTINIEKNSTLVYNRFMVHNSIDNEVNINQVENSTINFNYSFIAYDKCSLKFNSNLKGNNNITNINVKAVSEGAGSVVLDATADVIKNIKDNDLCEDLRVLLLNNEESVIIPNLLVSSNEVSVNHAATIGSIDKNYMFYLNSKGIDEKSAIDLIKMGYLLSILQIDENNKDKIKNLI